MREVSRDIVAAVILSKDKKILMGRKHPSGGGVYVDCWHIPGGGIESGEDQVQALQREVLEEVGVDVRTAQISLLSDDGTGSSIKRLTSGEEVVCQMKFFVYLVVLSLPSSGVQVKLSDDLCEVSWFRSDEIDTLKVVPASVTLFKLYRDRIFGADNKLLDRTGKQSDH